MKIYLDSIQKEFHPDILTKYNILQINSNDIGNCYEIEFEGNKEDLKALTAASSDLSTK